MKKMLLVLSAAIICCGCSQKRDVSSISIQEDLYIKSVYIHMSGNIRGGGLSKKNYNYVVGTLLGSDTIFIISGEEIIKDGQESIYKLGDKILEGK